MDSFCSNINNNKISRRCLLWFRFSNRTNPCNQDCSYWRIRLCSTPLDPRRDCATSFWSTLSLPTACCSTLRCPWCIRTFLRTRDCSYLCTSIRQNKRTQFNNHQVFYFHSFISDLLQFCAWCCCCLFLAARTIWRMDQGCPKLLWPAGYWKTNSYTDHIYCVRLYRQTRMSRRNCY